MLMAGTGIAEAFTFSHHVEEMEKVLIAKKKKEDAERAAREAAEQMEAAK